MKRIPASDIDLFTDQSLADPYPLYQELRDLGAVVELERNGVYAGGRNCANSPPASSRKRSASSNAWWGKGGGSGVYSGCAFYNVPEDDDGDRAAEKPSGVKAERDDDQQRSDTPQAGEPHNCLQPAAGHPSMDQCVDTHRETCDRQCHHAYRAQEQ